MQRLSFFCNVETRPKDDYYKLLETREFYTTTELSRKLKQDTTFVTKLIMNNNLKAVKAGGRYLVNKKLFRGFWIRNKYRFQGVRYAKELVVEVNRVPKRAVQRVKAPEQPAAPKATPFDWRAYPTAVAVSPERCVDLG